MRVRLTLLLVILTTHFSFQADAFTNFYCPKGDEAFVKDRTLPACDNEELPAKTDSQSVHLFDIRKSYHPENVLVIYSRVTKDCKFPETARTQELIDLYWRMAESDSNVCRKESAVKERIRAKLKIHGVSADRSQMTVSLDDLDKVRHDLPDRAAIVTLSADNETKTCRATITFSLSATDKAKILNLTCVFGEPVMWMGFPAPVEEVEALTLVGLDENGKEIRKRFKR